MKLHSVVLYEITILINNFIKISKWYLYWSNCIRERININIKLIIERFLVVQWKVKEQKDTVVSVIQTKLLNLFMHVLLKTLKCAIVVVLDKLGLVKPYHRAFYEKKPWKTTYKWNKSIIRRKIDENSS